MGDARCRRLLKEIKEAHDRRDAPKYFELYNKLKEIVEMPIRDEKLYAIGKADANYLARKEESDIEAMVDEEEAKPPPVERTGIWETIYNVVEREGKRNIKASIFCQVNGYVSLKGGWVAHLIYDLLGKKYRDIFVDYDHNVDVKEALDSGLEELTHYLTHPVKKTGSNRNIYYIQIGNFPKKDQPDPLDIFSREMKNVTKVPQMRKLLVRCCSEKYGEGKETDLSQRPPWTIRKIFRNWIRKVENRETR